MAAISASVTLDRVSAITGYSVKGSLAGIKAGNLPQRIAVLAEANTANQVGLPASLDFTSSKEVGAIMGYGSPAHIVSRILRPASGDVLGGIPTLIYPIDEAAGATATVITIGITGTATKNTTHKLVVSGRDQLDGDSYSFAVADGDTAAEISQKMIDAINGVIGAPAIGSVVADDAVFTTKWKGVTSAEFNISIDTGDEAAGLTYSEDSNVAGAGLPSVADALAAFGDEWNTLVVNTLNDSSILNALEAFNGNVNAQSGRYLPTTFKPFVAFFGDNSVTTLAAATAITDGRKDEMTNSFCPAPNSDGFSFEAPANVAFLYAKLAQDTPQSDLVYISYPDMPTASDMGDFSDPSKRDQLVKVGASTIKLNSGKYQIVDLVTTYHPDNEPQTAVLFRWVRDMVGVDWNVKYKYTLLENIYVIGKTLVDGDVVVTAANTISAKAWKGILTVELAPQLQDEALSASADFMKESIEVQIGESNPNRFETKFGIKRTGIARVLSTTNEALFNFGG